MMVILLSVLAQWKYVVIELMIIVTEWLMKVLAMPVSENSVMYNGALQKTIAVSSTLAKGMYMVRIVVNNKTYKTPLVYEK